MKTALILFGDRGNNRFPIRKEHNSGNRGWIVHSRVIVLVNRNGLSTLTAHVEPPSDCSPRLFTSSSYLTHSLGHPLMSISITHLIVHLIVHLT